MENHEFRAMPYTRASVALYLAITCAVTLGYCNAVIAEGTLSQPLSGAETPSTIPPGNNSTTFPLDKTWEKNFRLQPGPNEHFVEKNPSSNRGIVTNAILVGDNKRVPPPANAAEFMQNLHDVISHDDLADVQYYAEKLGFVLEASDVGQFYHWGPLCGKLKSDTIGQFFNNHSVPWYTDEARRFNNRCGEYPYEIELLKNGLIHAGGSINIDTNKMCITNKELDNLFEDANFTHGPDNRSFAYKFDGNNSIDLFAIPTNSKGCVGFITLIQNTIEEKK